jgi:hypothetical protein
VTNSPAISRESQHHYAIEDIIKDQQLQQVVNVKTLHGSKEKKLCDIKQSMINIEKNQIWMEWTT